MSAWSVGRVKNGKTIWFLDGPFEFGYPPFLPSAQWGDGAKDNGGSGRYQSFNECAQCGKLFLRTALALVPISCGGCYSDKHWSAR